jgi:hypothetical protein
MPLLIQHMINTIVPKQSPLLLRPLARKMFGQVDGLFVEPEVNRLADMVRPLFGYSSHVVMLDFSLD